MGSAPTLGGVKDSTRSENTVLALGNLVPEKQRGMMNALFTAGDVAKGDDAGNYRRLPTTDRSHAGMPSCETIRQLLFQLPDSGGLLSAVFRLRSAVR
ncbi:MAG: hypothetical protein ABIG63_12910 [Chloroflexota bacterium]